MNERTIIITWRYGHFPTQCHHFLINYHKIAYGWYAVCDFLVNLWSDSEISQHGGDNNRWILSRLSKKYNFFTFSAPKFGSYGKYSYLCSKLLSSAILSWMDMAVRGRLFLLCRHRWNGTTRNILHWRIQLLLRSSSHQAKRAAVGWLLLDWHGETLSGIPWWRIGSGKGHLFHGLAPQPRKE